MHRTGGAYASRSRPPPETLPVTQPAPRAPVAHLSTRIPGAGREVRCALSVVQHGADGASARGEERRAPCMLHSCSF